VPKQGTVLRVPSEICSGYAIAVMSEEMDADLHPERAIPSTD